MHQIVFASGNLGKIKEVAEILEPLGLEVIPQSVYDVPEVAETGTTFVENAIIKARNAAKFSGLPAIADDSGLEVDALEGAPGVYSARYSGPNATDQSNNANLLSALSGIDQAHRTARYQCLMVYMHTHQDATPLIFQGAWEGRIAEEESGESGFGYDPLFYLDDLKCTAAELPSQTKHRLSHRGKALRKLFDVLKHEHNHLVFGR